MIEFVGWCWNEDEAGWERNKLKIGKIKIIIEESLTFVKCADWQKFNNIFLIWFVCMRVCVCVAVCSSAFVCLPTCVYIAIRMEWMCTRVIIQHANCTFLNVSKQEWLNLSRMKFIIQTLDTSRLRKWCRKALKWRELLWQITECVCVCYLYRSEWMIPSQNGLFDYNHYYLWIIMSRWVFLNIYLFDSIQFNSDWIRSIRHFIILTILEATKKMEKESKV